MNKIIQINFFSLWMMLFMIIMLIYNTTIHPVSLMILMILFNLMICFNFSIWKSSFMFSIMLFLIMISGLLIIFMYFSSLISNEQMKISMNYKFFLILSMTILSQLMLFLNNNLFIYNQFYNMNFDSNPINLLNLNKFFNLLIMYNYPYNNFTLLSMFFILWSFLTIMKINSSSHSLSMRKINLNYA